MYKLSPLFVLISLFLFISACTTTKTTDPKTGIVTETTSIDLPVVESLTDKATTLLPTLFKSEPAKTPASQLDSRTPRQSSDPNSQRNNSSNNSNQGSKKSSRSSCNTSGSNNPRTCR